MRLRSWIATLVVVVASLALLPVFAQDNAGGAAAGGGGGAGTNQQGQAQDQQGGRGNRGGFGGRNFDPQQMRQMMLQRTKDQLGATDEEWQVLQPKVEKVMTAQRDAMAGRFGGFGRGGRGPNGGGDQNAVAKASEDLRSTLEDKNASADVISAKLQALRDARAKAQEELKTAQKELKDVLTQRQEAVLVSMGMLD